MNGLENQPLLVIEKAGFSAIKNFRQFGSRLHQGVVLADLLV